MTQWLTSDIRILIVYTSSQQVGLQNNTDPVSSFRGYFPKKNITRRVCLWFPPYTIPPGDKGRNCTPLSKEEVQYFHLQTQTLPEETRTHGISEILSRLRSPPASPVSATSTSHRLRLLWDILQGAFHRDDIALATRQESHA